MGTPRHCTGVIRYNDTSNFRRAQESEGKQRTEAESKRLSDALEAKREEAASNPTPILDAQTEAKKKYDLAIAAIQAKAAEPVHMTEDELQAAHQRKTELTARYNAARDESLRPVVAVEKF